VLIAANYSGDAVGFAVEQGPRIFTVNLPQLRLPVLCGNNKPRKFIPG
jgi:hypothetical protein